MAISALGSLNWPNGVDVVGPDDHGIVEITGQGDYFMLDPIMFMKHVLAIRFGRRSDEGGGEG